MKKRIFALLMAALLLCAFCFADGFDFSSYNDDQLLELIRAAQQEAADRHLSLSAELMGGSYIAGEDIPVGKYIFRCTYKGDWWANMTVYSDRGEGDQKEWEVITSDEGEVTMLLTLEMGDELECDAPFTLEMSRGIMFR